MPVTRQEKNKQESTEQSPTTHTGTSSATAKTHSSTAVSHRPPSASMGSLRVTKGCAPSTDASTVKRKSVVLQKKPRVLSQRGEGPSNNSKTRASRVAKAKEELLRLQVELAAARLAALEAEETDDELEEAEGPEQETNERVDSWLQTQPQRTVLAIAEAPHFTDNAEQNRTAGRQSPLLSPTDESEIAALAEAIIQAVKATSRPKFVDGSHQEWLPFRAAYYETKNMFSAVENTNRPPRNLKGRAREALISSAHSSADMKTLESRFGRQESIAISEMETLRRLPRLTDSPRDICIFSTKVSNVVATLRALGCTNYMYNPEVTMRLVDKLTPTLRYRYYDFAATQPRENPGLERMERFLKRESELCGPYALPEPVTQQSTTTRNRKPQRVNNKEKKSQCPVCDKRNHSATECFPFKKLDENARWETAKAKRLCFSCLQYRGKNHTCKRKVCEVNGCQAKHHKLLHYTK